MPFDRLRASGYLPLPFVLSRVEVRTARLDRAGLPQGGDLLVAHARQLLEHLLGVLAQVRRGPLGPAGRA